VEFTEITKECLTKSGWYEARKIDISEYEKVLANGGYSIFDCAKKFLEQFGGLIITHPHRKVPEKTSDININPRQAVEGIYIEKVKDYEKIIGSPLVVVGEAHNRHMVLLMSSKGAIYEVFDDIVLFLGESGTDALNCLCNGFEPSPVNTQARRAE